MSELKLSGRRKAAIFLAALGADASAKVFRSLHEGEIESLSAELSQLPDVDEALTSSVLREFFELALARQGCTAGGLSYATEVLEKALGRPRAAEILTRLQAASPPPSFAGVKKAGANRIATVLRREHPQTAALVLASLEADAAASILAGLPAEIRAEVVLRVATLDRASPEIVKQIEQILERQVAGGLASGASCGGGTETVAEVLKRIDPTLQREILGQLDEASPDVAEKVRALMFTFEDLVGVDDRGLQRVIREVDQKDLALALKAAGEAVAGRIVGNMSERTAAILKLEMDLMRPVRVGDVEKAQRRIAGVARRLQEAGEIAAAARAAS